MTPRGLARKIRKFHERPPVTSELERALATRSIRKNDRVWYTSQKEHWLGWLSEYDGPGAYGRKTWDRSAEFVYNHIVCPPMVLWLGEAAGLSKTKIQAAKRAALTAPATLAAQCAAIRKIIPWAIIEERLAKAAN